MLFLTLRLISQVRTSVTSTAIEVDMRDRISMARMICVLGMIFVHVPDGQTESPVYAFNAGGLGFFLEGLLVEGPGRASAALLSVVSGYLAAFALLRSRGTIQQLYKRRFVSIVLPMIFWATVTYLVYLLVSQSRPTFLDDATSFLDTLNIILFVTEMPIGATMHLGFLRDLFVCVLLTPILIPAVQRIPWALLSILCLFYLLEHDQGAILILRPLVLFAFTIGLTLAVRNVRLNSLDRYCPLFIVVSMAATVTIMLVNGGAANSAVQYFSSLGLSFEETILYPVGRLCGSLAVRCTPYVFAAFCSHYLMLTVLFFAGWMPMFGDRESDAFIIWFLAAPSVSMLIAFLLVQSAVRLAPPLATLITGGRVRAASNEYAPMARRRSHQGIA